MNLGACSLPSYDGFSYTNVSHTLGLQTVFLYTAEPTMDSAPMILEDKQKNIASSDRYLTAYLAEAMMTLRTVMKSKCPL